MSLNLNNMSARQRNIVRTMENRKPSLTENASQGDKVARHWTEVLLGAGDYLESDMDGPKGLVQE